MAEEEAPTTTPRAPVALPTYTLGKEGSPEHFTSSTSREAAAEDAKALDVGDAAFIKRSDLKWTYAIVTEKIVDGESTTLRFEVDADRNRKSFPNGQWGKYIRVVKISDEEMEKLKAEAEEEKEEEKKVSSAASTGGQSSTSKTSKSSVKSNTSWFGGIFGSPKKEEKKKAAVEKIEEDVEEAKPEEPNAEEAKPAEVEEKTEESAPVEEKKEEASEEKPALTVDTADVAEDKSVETPIEKHSSKEEESAPEPDNTKENSDPDDIKITAPPTFLPSGEQPLATIDGPAKLETIAKEPVDTTSSALRSPLNLKKTLSLKKKNSGMVSKLFKKTTPPRPTEKKVIIESPKSTAARATAASAFGFTNPLSPNAKETKKEWFDPEASEVDYDKNPTDLFQALEARQFDYVDEMYGQVPQQFTKECRTWVVARGQKKKDSAKLRFRALPLHAALVFGAPDDMIKKILHAYPKATRGRDVKGRLPIHLAMEHNASEEVAALIIEAFPKGYFAKDKKDMVALDYVTLNMGRGYMKKYIPLLTEARVEEERAKWEIELASALEAQKLALKTDPEYMEDVIATITDDVETQYASKMELLETNYQKEIQLLKRKHDSETQALLEGFEVKLNFERKLQKLKGKA